MFPTRVIDSLKYLLYPAQFVKLDQSLSLALTRLAEEEKQSLDEVGQKMLSFALQHRQEATKSLNTWQSLTPREKEITALACLSYTNKEIADQLIISPATVKTHLRNAKRKFGLRSKLELRKTLADWDFSQWAT
ncbi:MAG: LuxR C-terminal-related transcriptional regulator [Anaerolineales bacterium]